MIKPRPRDVVDLREGLLRMWRSPAGEQMAHLTTLNEMAFYNVSLGLKDQAQYFRESEIEVLSRAQLYWVSAEMTQLLDVAALDLPVDSILHEEDLISPFGFVVFEEPLHGIDSNNPDNDSLLVDAVEWGFAHIADEPGLFGLELACYEFASRFNAPELTANFGPLYFLGAASWPFNWRVDQFSGPFTQLPQQGRISMAEDRRRILAFFLLLSQGITETTQAVPDRAMVRAYHRQQRSTPPTVSVVNLRRTSKKPPATATGRTWDHRTIVRGHWRNHWYPSKGEHRRIYIHPHIAGPEDRPLRVSQRVYAWRR